MKGSGYSTTDKDGHTITSIDEYRAYLIIVDRHSRFTWTFLTKSKAPPLEIITTFLKQHGQPDLPHKTIRTDEGGELWYCQAFRQTVLQAGYLLEPTAAGAPSQNIIAKQPGNGPQSSIITPALDDSSDTRLPTKSFTTGTIKHTG